MYIFGRNPARLERAVDELREQTGKEALTIIADLANLRSIKNAVEEFQKYVSPPSMHTYMYLTK